MTVRSCTDTAKVYRKAAAYLFRPSPSRHWGCCDAINQIVNGDPIRESGAMTLFENIFKPSGSNRMYWMSENEYIFTAKDQAHRVLALCFMAAMVEAGDA